MANSARRCTANKGRGLIPRPGGGNVLVRHCDPGGGGIGPLGPGEPAEPGIAPGTPGEEARINSII